MEKPYIVNEERMTREEYRKTKVDQFLTRVPIGQKEVIKAHAAAMGEPLNVFVNRAITEQMARDRDKASE